MSSAAPERCETFPHGSDIGVRGVGPTIARAFELCGLALTSAVTDPARVRPLEVSEFACEAPDVELLLLDWLNALVYEMSARRMLFSRFEAVIDGERLRARAWGEKVDVARHEPAVEVKGATPAELEVARQADGAWRAQCVVDV